MPTKQELESMDFSGLDALLRKVAENPSASSFEADQARGLQKEIREIEQLKNSKSSSDPHPVLSGKTIVEARSESLKMRVVDFLLATLPLHKVASGK
jgi:hypothetical protein